MSLSLLILSLLACGYVVSNIVIAIQWVWGMRRNGSSVLMRTFAFLVGLFLGIPCQIYLRVCGRWVKDIDEACDDRIFAPPESNSFSRIHKL